MNRIYQHRGWHYIFRGNNQTVGLHRIASPGENILEFIGLDYLVLEPEQTYCEEPKGQEVAIVVLSGDGSFESKDIVADFKGRISVFDGKADTLYTCSPFKVKAKTTLRLAIARALIPPGSHAPADFISKERVSREYRGIDGFNRRHVDDIIKPTYPNIRMILGETFNHPANWSSYPPHKHDEDIVSDGKVIEQKLEEIYFYQFDPPGGFGLQAVYSRHDQDAFEKRDCYLVAQNDAVILPYGYHPVSVPPGIKGYYLWILASDKIGSERPPKLTPNDDPAYNGLCLRRKDEDR